MNIFWDYDKKSLFDIILFVIFRQSYSHSKEVLCMARRGENIYKRKDGRWEGRYIKGRDYNGKAIYGYVYSKTYSGVKENLNKIKADIENRSLVSMNSKKLFVFAAEWLETVLHCCKQSTYVKYRNTVYKHIIPELGDIVLSNIDTNKLNAYCQRKLFIDKLSPKSVRDILSVIKQIFKYASNSGAVNNCNLSDITIKSNRTEISIITNSQLRNLIDFLTNHISYTNVGILLSIYTGIRIGEICALKYDDLNIEDKILRIDKTMQRIQNFNGSTTKTDIIISSPKSSCSLREIPIPQSVVNIIMENNLYKKSAYILTGEKDRYIEPRTLQNRFSKIASICGLDNITFHTLRHTFASNCIEAGVDVKSLSEILGHSNVNITLNRYVHSSMQIKKMNIEKLYSFCLTPSIM